VTDEDGAPSPQADGTGVTPAGGPAEASLPARAGTGWRSDRGLAAVLQVPLKLPGERPSSPAREKSPGPLRRRPEGKPLDGARNLGQTPLSPAGDRPRAWATGGRSCAGLFFLSPPIVALDSGKTRCRTQGKTGPVTI